MFFTVCLLAELRKKITQLIFIKFGGNVAISATEELIRFLW